MTIYCACETPVMDVEHDAGCRRCGRPVDFSPSRGARLTELGRQLGEVELGGEPVTTWPSRDELRAEGLDPDTGVATCSCTYGAYARPGGGTGWDVARYDPACPEHGDGS